MQPKSYSFHVLVLSKNILPDDKTKGARNVPRAAPSEPTERPKVRTEVGYSSATYVYIAENAPEMKNLDPNEQNNATVCCHPISSSTGPPDDISPVIKYKTPAKNKHTPSTSRRPTRSRDGIMKN